MNSENLYKELVRELNLELVAGETGLNRSISLPEIERPGLGLAGFFDGNLQTRFLLFGKAEMEFLKKLTEKDRLSRLQRLFAKKIPAIFVARSLSPFHEMTQLCNARHIPLFISKMPAMHLMSKCMRLLSEHFAPTLCCHGSLVEVFGMGILIQGDSAVGKSEAALGLIGRGHRLISDDIVKIRKIEEGYLEGFATEMTKNQIEVRGIGIINIEKLYGSASVREKKNLDIVVKLEVWDDSHFYDRAGLDEMKLPILGINVPHHTLPVKPGRDVVLLLETIALNHRLKKIGFHSARDFDSKLLEEIKRKGKKSYEIVGAQSACKE
jgi:HPr kinase/phosphorylase